MRDQNNRQDLPETLPTTPGIHRAAPSIEFWSKALGFAYLVTLTFGGLLMCTYFLRNSFNPGGISASDALALSLLTFAFFVTLTIFAAFGAIGCYPLLRAVVEGWRLFTRGRRANPEQPGGTIALDWKKGNNFYLVAGIVIDAIIIVAATAVPLLLAIQFGFMFLAFGVFPCILIFGKLVEVYSRYPRRVPDNPIDRWYQRLPYRRRQLFAVSFITGSLTLIAFPDLQDLSMKLFGYRKDRVDVRMKKEDFDFLIAQSMSAGRAVNDCEPIVAGEYLVRRVDVIWHKFGSQALLRYPAVPMGQPELPGGMRVEIPNSDFKLVHARRDGSACAEIWDADLFDGKDIKPTVGATLKQKAAFLENAAEGAGITLTLYGTNNDLDPVLRATQAQGLRKQLIDTFGLSKVDLEVVQGRKNRLKWNCDNVALEIRDRCMEANSRVEIALHVTAR
ncbi:hypothetical protein [Pseudoduganella albidiflava]|uniref:OmpA family protein n=1 Tax=Pseudoduganella albidiflava TaxID=321983 RepID=A0A411X343_9BURK|nr:hypothetical protein [Pseudoduganella albidiflava]QBI03417.1 hypothetical protein EYF70_23280 [Pseudoduganella albidiflava]GGY49862.1 hypothetical protein GCM10007387_35090 [Pseudoduganella albidiflava]